MKYLLFFSLFVSPYSMGFDTKSRVEPPSEATLKTVTTKLGPVIGELAGESIRFFGIPYADPPIGDLRWRPPQGMPSWTELLDARSPGPHCPQNRYEHLSNEDCLTLNVFLPISKPEELKPVLVWIHGGAYRTGTGSHYSSKDIKDPNERIDGNLWNAQGIILVSLNYRLGALGFFAHPALDQSFGANFGLLDSVAALRWIQSNIHRFGGDKNRITVKGGPAGGHAVQSLMVMPQARGLFWAAVSQSGYGTMPLPRVRTVRALSGSSSAEDIANKIIARVMNKKEVQITKAYLRSLNVSQLVKAVEGYHYPIIDGVSLLEEPGILFGKGYQHPVPYMTGVNSFEGSGYKVGVGLSPTELLSRMKPFGEEITSLYDIDLSKKNLRGVKRLFGDHRYVIASRYTAQQMHRVESEGYLYLLSYIPPDMRAEWSGAPHSWQKRPLFQDTSIEVINLMRKYISNFVKTGNPNEAGIPHWPSVERNHSPWMIFDDETQIQFDVWPEKLNLLDQIYQHRVSEIMQ